MSHISNCFKNYGLILSVNIFVLLFSINLASAKSAPESFADLAEKLSPSVVNISTTTVIEQKSREMPSFPPGSPFEDFFKQFENPNGKKRRAQSLGSGFIIDETGYIITNNHVIDNAEKIMVILYDDTSFEAKVVGKDPKTDVALLKIEPKNIKLKAVDFADSNDLRVGDWVMAIGNPFGFGGTVTAGIVSARGRNLSGSYDDYIQTDASINRGNSGGPLFDMNGKVVGINTAIYAPSGGNVGIGFAIPANMTAAIIAELIENGEVNRGYVGAVVQPLNRELAKAFDVLPADGAPAGVVGGDVQPASSAEKAGLTPGDVIVQMGDKKITSVADFENQAAVMFIGDRLDIVLVRQGEQQTLTLEIFADTQEQVAGQRITPRLNGVVLQNLSAADDLGGGVVVAEVMINSSAYAYGLRSGDIIVGANRNTVTDIAELREAVRRDNRRLMLRVYRNGRFGPITIR